MTSAERLVSGSCMRRPASGTRARMSDGEVGRRRYLAAVERKPAMAARGRKLERALAATEAQLRSVEDQIAHLTRFRRVLNRYIRALRLVIASDAPASSPHARPVDDRRAAATRGLLRGVNALGNIFLTTPARAWGMIGMDAGRREQRWPKREA